MQKSLDPVLSIWYTTCLKNPCLPLPSLKKTKRPFPIPFSSPTPAESQMKSYPYLKNSIQNADMTVCKDKMEAIKRITSSLQAPTLHPQEG